MLKQSVNFAEVFEVVDDYRFASIGRSKACFLVQTWGMRIQSIPNQLFGLPDCQNDLQP